MRSSSLLKALVALSLITLTLAGCKQWVMKLPQAIHKYPFVRVISVRLVNPLDPVPVANLKACHAVCDKAGCKAFAFYYDQLLCSIAEAYEEDGPRILTPDAVQGDQQLGFYVAAPHDQEKLPYCPSREAYGRYLQDSVRPWLFPELPTTPALPIAASSTSSSGSPSTPQSSTTRKDTTQTSGRTTTSSSSSSTTTTPSGVTPATSTSTSFAPSTSAPTTAGSSSASTNTSTTPSKTSTTTSSGTTTEEPRDSSSSSLRTSARQTEATVVTEKEPAVVSSKTTPGATTESPKSSSTSTTTATTSQKPGSTVPTTTTISDAPSSTASSTTSTAAPVPPSTTEVPSTSTSTRATTTASESTTTSAKKETKKPCTVVIGAASYVLADGAVLEFSKSPSVLDRLASGKWDSEPVEGTQTARVGNGKLATFHSAPSCRVSLLYRTGYSNDLGWGNNGFGSPTDLIERVSCSCEKTTSTPRATTTTATVAPTTSEADATSTSTRATTTTTPEDPIYAGYVTVGDRRFDVACNVDFRDLNADPNALSRLLYSGEEDDVKVSVTVLPSCEITLEMGVEPNPIVPRTFTNEGDSGLPASVKDVIVEGFTGIRSASGRCANSLVPESAKGW